MSAAEANGAKCKQLVDLGKGCAGVSCVTPATFPYGWNFV